MSKKIKNIKMHTTHKRAPQEIQLASLRDDAFNEVQEQVNLDLCTEPMYFSMEKTIMCDAEEYFYMH